METEPRNVPKQVEAIVLKIETTKTYDDGRRLQDCTISIPEEARQSLRPEFVEFDLELKKKDHVTLTGLQNEFEGLKEGDRVLVSIPSYQAKYPLPYYRIEKKEE